MIEDLTELARVEGGQLQLRCEPVEMGAYLRDFVQRSETVLDISRVHLDIAEQAPPVLADYDRLDRIVTNLLSNALKYSECDTPVQVRVSTRDDEVLVSITDHGRGISPDDISHLFQRFYRAKGERRAEGIGLGLYITNNWWTPTVDASGSRVRSGRGVRSRLCCRSCLKLDFEGLKDFFGGLSMRELARLYGLWHYRIRSDSGEGGSGTSRNEAIRKRD